MTKKQKQKQPKNAQKSQKTTKNRKITKKPKRISPKSSAPRYGRPSISSVSVPSSTVWSTSFPAVLPKLRIRGSQLLAGSFTPKDTTSSAYVVSSVNINPLSLGSSGGRLGQFAKLFEKYRFNWMEVLYQPSAAYSTSGTLFIAIDNDPLDTLSGLSGNGLLSALEGMGDRCRFFSAFSPCTVKVSGKAFFSDDLYVSGTNVSDRWTQAGTIYWGVVAPTGTATTTGILSLAADVSLITPANPEVSAASSTTCFKAITSPSQVNPWGTNTDWLANNLSVVYSVTASKSVLTFYSPGVYLITWYQTMSVTGAETFTYVGTCNAATIPGITAQNLIHPSAEQAGWVYVNVYAADPTNGYPSVTYSSAGTHSTSQLNQLSVSLTPRSIITPSPVTSTTIDSIMSKLNALELAAYGGPSPSPSLGPTFTSDSHITGTITPFAGAPLEVDVDVSTSTDQILPVDVLPPDPAAQRRSLLRQLFELSQSSSQFNCE
jgi:hypothetical protein